MPIELQKTVLGILSKTFFSCRFRLFRMFLCHISIWIINADRKPKERKTKILKTLNICWHTVRIYCAPVFFSTCVSIYELLRRRLYRKPCTSVSTFNSKLAECVYHNSTMLLLSQLTSASGGLFSVWDCAAHPTHPEGIWKINPHLSNWNVCNLVWQTPALQGRFLH